MKKLDRFFEVYNEEKQKNKKIFNFPYILCNKRIRKYLISHTYYVVFLYSSYILLEWTDLEKNQYIMFLWWEYYIYFRSVGKTISKKNRGERFYLQ